MRGGTGADLYAVLGVPADADAEELRRAYLREARAHHPDRGGPDAGDRMRELNAAWAVLGDPRRRTDYDRRRVGGPTGGRAYVRPLDDTFVPHDDGDDDGPVDLLDDRGDPRTAPGRAVLVPVGLAAAAVLAGLGWVILDDERLLPVAVVLGVVAAVSLFVLPLVAMTRAARFERR